MTYKYNKYLFLCIEIFMVQLVLGHGDHNKRNKIPNIGKVYGIVVDSTSQKPIEYASISLINPDSKNIVTGGLSNHDGIFMIDKIPLGF